ncbi:MAG: SIMPL domain-containing protein [Candidatus Thiodiazotropha sp.]
MRRKEQGWIAAILIGLALIFTNPLAAQDEGSHYDRITLQTQASEAVENDTLIAVLYAQKEGPDLAPLTTQVNHQIGEAVNQAHQVSEVRVSTLGYQTYPVYQQQVLSGWRVRQSIRLESRNSEILSALIGNLQSGLALESIRYTLSSKQRESVEQRLILQAIDGFRQRAEQITQQMERHRYRLVDMTIHTDTPVDTSPPMRARMMAMEASIPPPTLEGGTQTVQVNIEGRIELQTE